MGTPPYPTPNYFFPPYNAQAPLGPDALTIDPNTGQLSGTPGIVGQFAVGICVDEYRNGVHIGTTRQDMLVSVVPCTPLFEAHLASDALTPDHRHIFHLCNQTDLSITNLSAPAENIAAYQWQVETPDGIATSTEEHPTFQFSAPGIYDGWMVVNPDSLCTDTLFFEVRVSDFDTDFEMAYDTCDAGPVDFVATPATTVDNLSSFRWYFGDGDSADATTTSHQYLQAGAYPVTLLIEDGYGCRDSLSHPLVWRPAPEVLLVAPETAAGCVPLQTAIVNRSVPVDSTYELFWDFGDGHTAEGIAPIHQYQAAGNYDIYLAVTSPYGCFIDTVFDQLILAESPPQADFDWSPQPLHALSPEASFTNLSQNYIGWQWYFEPTNFLDIRPSPIYAFPDTGHHVVTLMVEDQYGCTDTLTKMVDVAPVGTYFLPNAFTPNNDGVNDVFVGIGITTYFQGFKMTVYDRWGQQVFTTQNPEMGWNGQLDNGGETLPNGVYIWQVEYVAPRGAMVREQGEVVLIR